jgi:hypothetical protein
MEKINRNNFLKRNFLIIIISLSIILISLSTSYIGSTDVGDYAGVAKYFSGNYKADIRSSHSFLYGVVHFPLFLFVKSFIVLKLINLIYLFLLIWSVYFVSGKNKKILYLFILSPIVWYMSPWINSIQLSALLFFWAYYFIRKFDSSEKLSFLFVSGALVGLSWGFWDAMIVFSIILGISFLYDKKFYHFPLFALFVFIGLIPKLIIDQVLFNFAFYGIMRYFFGLVTAILWKGIYGSMQSSGRLLPLIFLLTLIPIFSYKLFSKTNIKKDVKIKIFLGLSLLFIFINFQIRYLLLIYPIILLNLMPLINKRQYKIQIAFSIALVFLTITPYIIQINNSSNVEEFYGLLTNLDNIQITEQEDKILKQDLEDISRDFPNDIFIVGNFSDYYARLATLYWGDKVKEFVSIEDYESYLNNRSDLFSKTLYFNPNINERRAIFIGGGIRKNPNDNTNYSEINYAISNEDKINVEGFELIKSYNKLNVFKKKSLP